MPPETPRRGGTGLPGGAAPGARGRTALHGRERTGRAALVHDGERARDRRTARDERPRARRSARLGGAPRASPPRQRRARARRGEHERHVARPPPDRRDRSRARRGDRRRRHASPPRRRRRRRAASPQRRGFVRRARRRVARDARALRDARAHRAEGASASSFRARRAPARRRSRAPSTRAAPRAKGPFVVIDATALPETLAESLLFGHERGAFTGASTSASASSKRPRAARCSSTRSASCPRALQPKFLRVLERRELTRVGGTAPIRVDVRVVAATHRDLRNEIDAGRFREDLYFRLAQMRVLVPPLRDRRDDVAVLCREAPRLDRRRPARSSSIVPRSITSRRSPGRATCASSATCSRAPPRCARTA